MKCLYWHNKQTKKNVAELCDFIIIIIVIIVYLTTYQLYIWPKFSTSDMRISYRCSSSGKIKGWLLKGLAGFEVKI